MAGKIRLAADLGAQRRIRGRFSKGHQPAGWRVAQPLAATKYSENLTINPDVVQPAIRRVDAFVTILPRVCRSLWSLLNSRLTGFNPRRARVAPVLSDNNNLKIKRKEPTERGQFSGTACHHPPRAKLRHEATARASGPWARQCHASPQVLEEDAPMVNPMISSAMRCVHGVGNEKTQEPRRGSVCAIPKSQASHFHHPPRAELPLTSKLSNSLNSNSHTKYLHIRNKNTNFAVALMQKPNY